MKSHFGIALITASIMVGNVAFSKDIKGTMIKCKEYNVYSTVAKKTFPAPAPATFYIAISKDQKSFCRNTRPELCGNFNNFSSFGYLNSSVDEYYYILEDTKQEKAELSRDGTYIDIYLKPDGLKAYSQCSWYKDISF